MADMDTSENGDEEEEENDGSYDEYDMEGDGDDDDDDCEEDDEHSEEGELSSDEEDVYRYFYDMEPASRASAATAVDLSAFKATALQCKAPATRKNYARRLKRLLAELPRYCVIVFFSIGNQL
jgi:ABC-type Zn2+ transport system substrate-binding protein/surface adhesin